jgi:hypothetical protein
MQDSSVGETLQHSGESLAFNVQHSTFLELVQLEKLNLKTVKYENGRSFSPMTFLSVILLIPVNPPTDTSANESRNAENY